MRLADESQVDKPGEGVAMAIAVVISIGLVILIIASPQLAFLGIVPLLVAGSIAARVRKGKRRERFGKSVLVAEPPAPKLGKPLRAHLTIEKLTPEEVRGARFVVTLSLVEEQTSSVRRVGRNPKTHTWATVLWSDQREIDGANAAAEAGGLSLPIAMEIPEDLQGSSDEVSWRLEVRAALKGMDYSSAFTVPVKAK